MNRITEEDKKRATKALERCAAETKDIEDKEKLNKKAYEILSEELGDKPELLKRACEGYNSAKSLYKFGTMGESRGDTFAILDAPKLAEMARKEASADYVHKVASANGFKKAQFSTVSSKPVMKKAASSDTARRHDWKDNAIPVHTMQKMSSVEAVHEINSCTEDMANCLHKVARDREEALQVMNEAEERFFSAMATETPSMRKQAAEMLVNAYGEFGKLLVDMFNVNAGHQKIASYNPNKYKGSVRLPDTVLFKSASAVLEAHANRVAADYFQDMFVRDAIDYVKDVFATRQGIQKRAAGPAAGFASTLAGVISADKLSERLAPSAGTKSEQELESEINTTELTNTLKRHSIKRAFMNTITDPTVARYPLHQVTQAFNDSLSELPIHMRDLPPTAFSALLKSRTIARLGRGGAASGSDVDQIQQIQQAFSRVRPKDISNYGESFDK